MKQLLLKILFTILALAFIFGMFAIAELLAKVINMDTIINTCYVVIVLGLIYVIRN